MFLFQYLAFTVFNLAATASCAILSLPGDSDSIFERFVLLYFENTYRVTIVNLNCEFGEHEDMIQLRNLPFAVVNSRNLHHIVAEFNRNAQNVESFPISEGFLMSFPAVDEDVMNTIMLQLSQLNPRAKYLIRTVATVTGADAYQLLMDIWQRYKILNVLILSPTQDMHGLRVNFINPFAPDGENSVYTEILTEDGLAATAQRIFCFVRMRIKNLQKFPLKIHMFEMPMISRAVFDSNNTLIGFDYADGEVLKLLSRILNFTTIFLPNTLLYNYGYRLPNKTYTGALAAIEYGYADIAANSKVIANIGTKKSLFLHPMDSAKLRIVVPKDYYSDRINMVNMNVLDDYSIIFYYIYFGSLPFLAYFLKYLEIAILPSYIVESHRTILEYFLLFWSLIFKVPIFWLPKTTHNRLIFLTVMVYSLVMCSIFQGFMFKTINTPSKKDINTIAEVYNSNLEIYCHNIIGSIIEKFNIPHELIIEPNSYLVVQNMTVDRNKALVTLEKFLYGFYVYFYDQTTGEEVLHTVPGHMSEFYTSMTVPKSSPFIEVFNEILMKCVENGVVRYQNQLAINDFLNLYLQRFKNVTRPEKQLTNVNLIGLPELGDIIEMYFYGVSAAGIVFVLEIICSRVRGRFCRR